MSVRTATFIFAILILTLFALWGVSLIKITSLLDREAQDLALAGESINVAKKLKSYLLIHNRNAFFYSLNLDRSRPATSRALHTDITDILVKVKRLISSREAESALAELESGIASYLTKLERLEASGIPPMEQYQELSKNVDGILPLVDKLIETNQARMDVLIKNIDTQNKMANKIGFFLLTAGGLVLLSLMGMMFFYIARPLRTMTAEILKFGSGKTSARIEPGGLAEIRQIGSGFNSMADRLQEKQKEQLRFISAIAHDLRSPLNSMSIAAELLDRRGGHEPGDLPAIILRQVRSLDRMVGDLLDTTRIEAGHLDLQFEDRDLNPLITDSIQLHRTSSNLHRFIMDLPEEPLLSRCDGARISQVLNNLLSNAIKYSPDGGSVTVKARRDGDKIVISVTDEGIGIAPQDLDDIFRPFNRTEVTRGTIPGIGLGLSASRHIVEGHGGELKVRSEQGSGSTFYFSLPAKAHRQTPPE